MRALILYKNGAHKFKEVPEFLPVYRETSMSGRRATLLCDDAGSIKEISYCDIYFFCIAQGPNFVVYEEE